MEKKKLVYAEDDKCPTCGLTGKYIPPNRKEGQRILVDFICPNGHQFTKEFLSK